MKRVWILVVCAFLAAVLLIFILIGSGSDSTAPRFVPGAPAALPGFTWDHYDWIADAPFQGGKIWMWTAGATNRHVYLYDLERRVLVGELLNGGVPELWRADSSQLVCQGEDSPAVSLKTKFVEWMKKVSRGRIARPGKRTETFWLVNLRSNSARHIGAISQFQGSGSRWHPSPDLRYGYTQPTAGMTKSIFLCDLESGLARNVPIRGNPKGWWNDREILLERGTNNFVLMDLTTQRTRTLFGPSDVSSFLTAADLPQEAELETFANWNGHEYDFYFGEKAHIYGLSGTNSFLLKAERSGPALKLLYRDFKFQWGGYLDSAATRYLYQGESGKPGSSGNGGVYLRNLTNDITTTVVPPDNKGQYAIPRFYGEEVIYFRNRLLQRVRLDGSNDVPVLAIEKK